MSTWEQRLDAKLSEKGLGQQDRAEIIATHRADLAAKAKEAAAAEAAAARATAVSAAKAFAAYKYGTR